MTMSNRAKANIERQTRKLIGGAGQAELNQPKSENVSQTKPKSRAELNIERQTALLNGKR